MYYIHSSDGTNSIRDTSKINGSSYIGWIIYMRRALGEKNKLSMVDHSILVLDHDDLYRSHWKRCNHPVHS